MVNSSKLIPLLLLLSFELALGQDSATQSSNAGKRADLPSAIRPELNDFEKDIQRAARQYLESAEKARKKAVAAMKKDLKSAMKRNNLESAVAIKAKIEELEMANLWAIGKPKASPDVKSNKQAVAQNRTPFHLENGYWTQLNDKFGVVIAGSDIYWVKDDVRNPKPATLGWNQQKGEYTFGKMAIRKTDDGLKLMNYSNGVLARLKKSPIDRLKK